MSKRNCSKVFVICADFPKFDMFVALNQQVTSSEQSTYYAYFNLHTRYAWCTW